MTDQNHKLVYFFGGNNTEGDATMKMVLGGKGANLAEMTNLGVPVPPGFTISTGACTEYYEKKGEITPALREQAVMALRALEETIGKKFGDEASPLLVSVRSGAPFSMPGMMDTILNLGLNDTTVHGLAAGGDERFAYDSYRRFIQMYGDVVLDVDHDGFEHILDKAKADRGTDKDTDLDADAWKDVVVAYKALVLEKTGKPFPQDPVDQLWGAIKAVFESWHNPRAVDYRRHAGISPKLGTAVNVQAMVFGNMGDDCATGVAFTRDPSTGAKRFFGEFLVNAQGEDVVAGTRTPQPIDRASASESELGTTLEDLMPEAYQTLVGIYKRLETHYRDMQDIEFTIERGKLWMLQTRTGKRTASAALKIAVDMVAEGLISQKEAVLRIEPNSLDQLLHPTLDPAFDKTVIAQGLPASPGAASGAIVFSADDAEAWAGQGKKVILVRTETSPEDIRGMIAAQGILTARGGMTSHAAVVARGMGKCCVAGCGALRISYPNKTMTVGGVVYNEGDPITLDGGTGQVITGEVPRIEAQLTGDFAQIMGWADEARTMGVRTNADTPADSVRARELGAEGIGLCRTEHMFFEGDRILSMRRLILSDTREQRLEALSELEPIQRADFEGIFEAMLGLPVTIRLLDPPLHEFLPHTAEEVAQLSQHTGVSIDEIQKRAEGLHESNPMLGHRGCRLGLTYPEIYEMQARAIIDAAVTVFEKHGSGVLPEIMIPLVGHELELSQLRTRVEKVAEEVFAARGKRVEYMIGTMIELPRACLVADRIAESAQFFSFGTNDLTQTTFGISRDDAATFLGHYVDAGIYHVDPFVSIDQDGLGQLMKLGIEKGRSVRPELKIGICGEHGGEPKSVEFCQSLGLNYVSCSPFRVPIARLAAGQAAIRKEQAA